MATLFLKMLSNGNKIFKNLVKWQQDFENLVKWQRDSKNLVKWQRDKIRQVENRDSQKCRQSTTFFFRILLDGWYQNQ